jgi:hypothetical protein
MEEIWKDVPEYEGLYQVSNYGRLKSFKCGKEKILKGSLRKDGYIQYTLNWKEYKKRNVYLVHQLVAMAFLGHQPCGLKLVVDHINDDKLDNRLENLQVVTNRYNVCKTQGKYSSQYKGVYFDKKNNKYRAFIHIKHKNYALGTFENEYDAHLAYQNTLQNLEQ